MNVSEDDVIFNMEEPLKKFGEFVIGTNLLLLYYYTYSYYYYYYYYY